MNKSLQVALIEGEGYILGFNLERRDLLEELRRIGLDDFNDANLSMPDLVKKLTHGFEICKACHGTGTDPFSVECLVCHGRGTVLQSSLAGETSDSAELDTDTLDEIEGLLNEYTGPGGSYEMNRLQYVLRLVELAIDHHEEWWKKRVGYGLKVEDRSKLWDRLFEHGMKKYSVDLKPPEDYSEKELFDFIDPVFPGVRF